MKTIEKTLNWLILAALLAVIAVCIFRTEKRDSKEGLPSIEVSEIQDLFPEAQQLQFLDTSFFAVKNTENETIGTVLLSSPYSDHIKGYAGKTPLLIALDNNGKIIADYITFHDEKVELQDNLVLFDPVNTWEKKNLKPGEYKIERRRKNLYILKKRTIRSS